MHNICALNLIHHLKHLLEDLAGKVKSQNNLINKFAGATCGASAAVLRTSTDSIGMQIMSVKNKLKTHCNISTRSFKYL